MRTMGEIMEDMQSRGLPEGEQAMLKELANAYGSELARAKDEILKQADEKKVSGKELDRNGEYISMQDLHQILYSSL